MPHRCIAILLKLKHSLLVGRGRLRTYRDWEAPESHKTHEAPPRSYKSLNNDYRGEGLLSHLPATQGALGHSLY